MPRSLVIAGAAVLALLTACAPAQVIDRGRTDAREVTLTFAVCVGRTSRSG